MEFEDQSWRISGVFGAGGAMLESELWCRLDGRQQVLKRRDLSLFSLRLGLERSYDSAWLRSDTQVEPRL